MSNKPIKQMKKLYRNIFINKNNLAVLAVKPITGPYGFFKGKSESNQRDSNGYEYDLTNAQKGLAQAWGVFAVIFCSPVLIPVTVIALALALLAAVTMAAVSPLLFGGAAIVQGVQHAWKSCKKDDNKTNLLEDNTHTSK